VELAAAEQVIGRVAKVSLGQGTVLTLSLVQEEALPTDDVRRIELAYVDLPVNIGEGDYVDIRIVFSNGEDYIVAGHKKVLSLIREDSYGRQGLLEVYLNEEEILKMASAKADYDRYEDTRIYLAHYMEDGQRNAQDTYPVNSDVYELSQWDPNVFDDLLTEENVLRRQVLEAHIAGLQEPDIQETDVQETR
jgi:hypothetical protein